jgi:hypothetical protein
MAFLTMEAVFMTVWPAENQFLMPSLIRLGVKKIFSLFRNRRRTGKHPVSGVLSCPHGSQLPAFN